jgi:hypothetical protein
MGLINKVFVKWHFIVGIWVVLVMIGREKLPLGRIDEFIILGLIRCSSECEVNNK